MSTLYTRPDRHDYLDQSIGDLHHRLIMESMLRDFAIERDACVVEIGAGAGRYTSLLLAQGLRVVAIEPDPILAARLRARHGNDERVQTIIGYPYDAADVPAHAVAVCGFHVLHHMDSPALERLSATLRQLRRSRPEFRGWFFLEPNPYNPLYPLQITLRASMHFREEMGIWRNRYDQTLGDDGASVTMGFVGYWPPGRLIASAPVGLQRLGTRVSGRVSLLRAYMVVGKVYGARTRDRPDGEIHVVG